MDRRVRLRMTSSAAIGLVAGVASADTLAADPATARPPAETNAPARLEADLDPEDVTARGGIVGQATSTVTARDMQERLARSTPEALRYEPGAFSEGADAGVRPRPPRNADHPDGGADTTRWGTVYVLQSGSPRPVRVRVGLIDEALTEVSAEGLAARALVVVDEIDSTPASARPGAAFGGSSRSRAR